MSKLTALGSKQAERKIIGCDLHASQQTIAMLDPDTGEVIERTLKHEGETVRDFYVIIRPSARSTIAANSTARLTGSPTSVYLRLLRRCRTGHATANGQLTEHVV